jgi:putative component of toxin-antitoxin plasmid stabilization module
MFYDLFHAVWVGPDRLFQVELEMKSEVKPVRDGGEVVAEERAPGIKVYVTQKRVILPGSMGRPERRTKPRGEIEVPSE